MSKKLLENDIAKALAGVQLTSRSASRFGPLQAVVARYLSVDRSIIGVKSLADSKNYGNRVSEATGTGVGLLVLVAGGAVDVEALGRAISNRCVRPVPALLLLNSSHGWEIKTQFLPSGHGQVIPGVPSVEVPGSSPAVAAAANALSLEQGIECLNGLAKQGEVGLRLAELTKTYPGFVVKHATGVKHLRNRIREAAGRRPSHLLVIVPVTLVPTGRAALSEALGAADEAVRFLLWEENDVVRVERVSAAAERDNSESSVNAICKSPIEAESSMQTSQENEYRCLERVKQLHRLLPLDANAKNLFEEHLESAHRLAYETTTFGYIQRLLMRDARTIVVLTGNAGHGKTHMCRRLLEDDDDPDAVMAKLQADKEGRTPWRIKAAALPIRVVKDLSELEPTERAAEILGELIAQSDAHVLVCANEGRLRAVVSHNVSQLKPVLDALDRGLAFGETNPPGDSSVHVVNLNFQAAAIGDAGFLEHVLTHFLDNQASWSVCNRCRASTECPIVANRMDLTLSPSARRDNGTARRALHDLVRIAEESGYVLTFREVLVFVAFLTTGGLTCEDVEQRHRDGRRRESLSKHRLLEVLFDAQLTEDQREVLRVLERIKRLDPGRIALRPVDEELHRELESEGKLGAGVFGEETVAPKSKRDRDREVAEYRAVIRRARRKAWFTSTVADDKRLGVTRSERLGFSHHELFRSLQDDHEASTVVDILRRLVKGLHAIQGAVNVDSKTSLHLVDPAFGRSGSHSAVISRSLRIKELDLVTESMWWRRRLGDVTPPVLEAVDWIDRRLLLVDLRTQEVLLPLDLEAFEFVMSAADGIVMREFNAGNRRRVLTRLALLAEKGQRESCDEIRVLLERGDGTLTVERDGTILLERS